MSAKNRLLMMIACVLAVAGCGGSPYPTAPVSGKVTLDDQPVPGARIGFEPQRKGDQINAGPGSYATTDDEGRFVLETLDGRDGAVVGWHRVSISTSINAPSRSDPASKSTPEKIPRHYLDGRTQLQFEVPPEGTGEANFALSSAPP